jgi:hypothetical protein
MSDGATAAVGAKASADGYKQPLDEIMLAMDVVDTLRRRERLLKRELDAQGREHDLKQRLRDIYQSQGIDVPEHVIEQGVSALKEERFVYRPSADGLATRLARLYVSRKKWGKWAAGGFAAPILALALNYFLVVAPNAELPHELTALHAQVLQIAKTDNARQTAERFLQTGQSALREDDMDGARAALAALEDTRSRLEQAYTLRIVNRAGEKSGLWRVPDVNSGARNYYIVVEAIDAAGKALKVAIFNEETRNTERVDKWAVRVDEKTFRAVAADKRQDGIIERDRFGYKARGHLLPSYEMNTPGGAITDW